MARCTYRISEVLRLLLPLNTWVNLHIRNLTLRFLGLEVKRGRISAPSFNAFLMESDPVFKFPIGLCKTNVLKSIIQYSENHGLAVSLQRQLFFIQAIENKGLMKFSTKKELCRKTSTICWFTYYREC